MKCGISLVKKRKFWIFKALNRARNKTVAWVTGKRTKKNFKRLYKKFKHLKKCIFYTDDWKGFNCLPKKRHVISKKETVAIERDNSNTRHHLARFTRKTKVVSKSEKMVNMSIKLWQNLTLPKFFSIFQARYMSVF